MARLAGMAYDTELADRIRFLIGAGPGVTEKKMFGGLAFLVGGNMAIGASGQGGALVRVDPDDSSALIATAAAGEAVMDGRVMRQRRAPGSRPARCFWRPVRAPAPSAAVDLEQADLASDPAAAHQAVTIEPPMMVARTLSEDGRARQSPMGARSTHTSPGCPVASVRVR